MVVMYCSNRSSYSGHRARSHALCYGLCIVILLLLSSNIDDDGDVGNDGQAVEVEEARLAAINEAKKPVTPKLSETTLAVIVDTSDDEEGSEEEEGRDEQGE